MTILRVTTSSRKVYVGERDIAHRNDPNAHANAVSSHSSQADLDSDDHSQYALTDGSRGDFAATGHDHDSDYSALSHVHEFDFETTVVRERAVVALTDDHVVVDDDSGKTLEVDAASTKTLTFNSSLRENGIWYVYAVDQPVTLATDGTITGITSVTGSATVRHRGSTGEFVTHGEGS